MFDIIQSIIVDFIHFLPFFILVYIICMVIGRSVK